MTIQKGYVVATEYTVVLVIVLTQQTTTTGKSAHDTSHLWCTTWPLFTHCTCKCTSSNMLTEIAVANNSNNVIDLHLRIKMRSRAVLWGCYATRGLPILLSSGSLSVILTTTIMNKQGRGSHSGCSGHGLTTICSDFIATPTARFAHAFQSSKSWKHGLTIIFQLPQSLINMCTLMKLKLWPPPKEIIIMS